MRFDGSTKTEANSLEMFGVRSYGPAYAAAISVKLQGGILKHVIVPDTLTGAATIDATFEDNSGDFEEVVFVLTADGTQRIVTPTGNVVGGVITVALNTTKVVKGITKGGKILIVE